MEHADLVAGIRAAGAEVSEALARAHGGGDLALQAAVRRDCLALVDDLCGRYRNRALGDPVGRVARDPLRKLAGDDRLIGSARLCVAHGVAFPALAAHIALACRYTPAADEPGRDRFCALQAQGWPALLAATAQLSPEDPVMTAISTAQKIAHFKATLPERRAAAAAAMRAAGIVLRDDEAAAVEIADFGLDRFEQYGLAIHVYVNTDRCCAKELVMVPGQICPEHRHPPVDGEPGKEETFRVRQGEVFLFLPGHKGDGAEKAAALKLLPADKHAAHTMYKCVHLKPGGQYTLKPNTPHWFAAGPQGAIVSEFSTKSRDEADIFTDTEIVRLPPA
jgi:D-lyxose ketol-isomerase